MNSMKIKVISKYRSAQLSSVGLRRLETFLVKHHIMASKSFADYKSGNICSKRLRIGWTVNVFIALYTIRYAVLCVYNPQWLLELLGEFNQSLARIDLISGVYICGGIIASFRQFLNLYFEQKFKFKAIDVLHGLMIKDPKYHLETKYQRSFNLRSRLMSELLLESLLDSTTLVLIVGMGLTGYRAYTEPGTHHSLVKVVISVIAWIVWYRYLLAIYLADFFIFYCITLYLKYSFRQLVPRLKSGIDQTIAVIDAHNSLTSLTETLNKFFCNSLGIVYACATPAVNILLTLAMTDGTALWKRFIFIFVFVELQVLMYLITYSAASISTENKNIPKSIYQIFIRRRIPLKNALKLMSFLEKLCSRFVGFYCFDFFPYTKMSFYEFFFLISCNYMLINKNLRNSGIVLN